MATFLMIFVVVCVLLLVIVTLSTVYVVRQQSVAIIERFGKYQKVANSGIHIRLPFGIDSIAARIQLRLLQSDIVVETKTKDNVFVMMNVATQYRVNEQSVTDAYYKLMRPESQIKSYIEDALRSSVPKLTLDELFEKKDEIALEVQKQVAEELIQAIGKEKSPEVIEAGEQNGYFWPAEDYHQKHRLRRNKQLVSLAEVDFGPRWDEHLYFTKLNSTDRKGFSLSSWLKKLSPEMQKAYRIG